MALSLIGWYPVDYYIDKKKLSFLQKLCTMPPDLLPRKIFNLRLQLYMLRGYRGQKCFIPDIVNILHKYELFNYMQRYLNSTDFPTTLRWKRIVHRALICHYTHNWDLRTIHNSTFRRFRLIHDSIAPSPIWINCDTRAEVIHATSAINALVFRQFYDTYQCKLCDMRTDDIMKHIVIQCREMSHFREKFYIDIRGICTQNMVSFLRQANSDFLFCSLYNPDTLVAFGLSVDNQKSFMKLACKTIHNILHVYKSA